MLYDSLVQSYEHRPSVILHLHIIDLGYVGLFVGFFVLFSATEPYKTYLGRDMLFRAGTMGVVAISRTISGVVLLFLSVLGSITLSTSIVLPLNVSRKIPSQET